MKPKKKKILTFGFFSRTKMKAGHAAKKLQEQNTEKARGERKRKRDRANKRKKKSWLVMFEARIISDILLSAERQSIALNIK